MRDVSAAGRYARALLIVTERRRETARALEDLRGLGPALAPGTRASAILTSPEVRLADKREALRRGLQGRVLPIVAVFVDLLQRKKRLGLFQIIVEEFEALVERSQGIRRAEVTSAVPLTDAETERLHASLERYLRSKVRLQTRVDPALLGGALARIGDRVVDRSVRTLLDSISRQLHEASV
jgi:F-type H+-transporting ATPase subunit delta